MVQRKLLLLAAAVAQTGAVEGQLLLLQARARLRLALPQAMALGCATSMPAATTECCNMYMCWVNTGVPPCSLSCQYWVVRLFKIIYLVSQSVYRASQLCVCIGLTSEGTGGTGASRFHIRAHSKCSAA